MKKSVFKGVVLTAVMAVLSCLTAVAGEPQADVKLILISVSGDSTVLGPGESARSHTADEYVTLEELEQAVPMYLKLLNGLRISE